MSYIKTIDEAIFKIPNYPRPGILFYDITGIFLSPTVFNICVELMVEKYRDKQIDGVVAIESRGFLLGSILAQKLNKPLILSRKKGKLPREVVSADYELEYGSSTLEIHVEDVKKGQKLVLVDDLVATGGTFKATVKILENLGAKPISAFAIVGLPFFKYQEGFSIPIETLITYDTDCVGGRNQT